MDNLSKANMLGPRHKPCPNDVPIGLEAQFQSGGIGFAANETGAGVRKCSHRELFTTDRPDEHEKRAKSQAPEKHQFRTPNHGRSPRFLKLSPWSFSGAWAWDLEIITFS